MHKPYILNNITNRNYCKNEEIFKYSYDSDMTLIKDNSKPLIDKLNNFSYGTSTENCGESDDIDLNILSLYTKTFDKNEQDDDSSLFF